MQLFLRAGRRVVLLAIALGASARCKSEPPISGRPPVPGVYLDRKSGAHGLIAREDLSADGGVVRDSPSGLRGEEIVLAIGGAATLELWKAQFHFTPRAPGEALQAFRDRTGISVYYNINELGLGRELGCAEFPDGAGTGQACFVTNYGIGFNDGAAALERAIEGATPKNTVCITRRPSLGPEYEVQFYVFGPDGKAQSWAQLDTLGPRPHPQVCTECHGGAYDEQTKLAKGAHFLPLYPDVVLYAEDFGIVGPAGVTKAGQLERTRVINALAEKTQLTTSQRERLDGNYDGLVRSPGAPYHGDWVPPGWDTDAWSRRMYHDVIAPYCVTCHDASAAAEHPELYRFSSQQRFLEDSASVLSYVCDTFTMPKSSA